MRLLLQIIFLIVIILGINNIFNYFENQKSTQQGMQAINQTTQACTIDLQNNKNVICD